MEQEYDEIDLRELIHVLLSKWWLIVIFLVVATGITGYVTMNHITPIYEAKSTLFIGKESNTIAGISMSDFQIDNKLVVDYRELIKTRLITEEVIRDLGLDISVGSFVERLDVGGIKDSRFMYITFKDSNPKMAAEITNKLSETLILRAEEIVGVEKVKIVDKAIVPQGPISPNVKMNIAISALLGIMLGVATIFVLNMFDNTIKKEEDIEKYVQLSVLGVIPRFKGEVRGNGN